jgi:COP9 signalosome complex subunit 6
MSDGGESILEISLHPLVIINISDHHTREKVNCKVLTTPRVFGAILGVQRGRKVELFNSFALLLHENTLDSGYFTDKIEQFKKVYEDYELLGWYSTGSTPESYDMSIHQQIMDMSKNEAPLFLLLNPNPDPNSRELPISILETELSVVNDNPVLDFAKVSYKIDTTDAERIAVDHVANSSSTSPDSMLTSYLLNIYKAINMLNQRIATIMRFVEMQKSGALPLDLRILRRVKALCQLLPAVDSLEFQQEFLNEYNDTLLVTYLATITKTSNTLNELIDKFNVTYEKHSRHRGFY